MGKENQWPDSREDTVLITTTESASIDGALAGCLLSRLTPSPWEKLYKVIIYYYPHSTDEASDAQRSKSIAQGHTTVASWETDSLGQRVECVLAWPMSVNLHCQYT